MLNKNRHARFGFFSPWLMTSAVASFTVLACSAGGDPDIAEYESEPEVAEASGGASTEVEPTKIPDAMGGAVAQVTHPLLGAGNYTGFDSTDPCELAQPWELDILLDLSTGALVLHEGTVYEVTGVGSDHGYTMESIAPPGEAPWVVEQYAYEIVQTCTE